mgnify:CR=1 FL=1
MSKAWQVLQRENSIDIGLKNDGLAHISKLSTDYLRHPSEKFSVGDIVDCYVEEVDVDRKKVKLSLLPIA